MTKTFFVADIHLNSKHRERKLLFIKFIRMVLEEKANLYILGDLFDFWANNMTVKRKNRSVFLELKKLTAYGLKAGFVLGNRDFLLKNKVLSCFGIEYLGETGKIKLDSKQILLTHGHTLCSSDLKFKRYKERAWPVFTFLDKILPGLIENYLAKKFILKSKVVINSQDSSKMLFSENSITKYFKEGIDIIICGHAHRIENRAYGNNRFYALPCWENKKGGYLMYDKGTFTFNEIDLN